MIFIFLFAELDGLRTLPTILGGKGVLSRKFFPKTRYHLQETVTPCVRYELPHVKLLSTSSHKK